MSSSIDLGSDRRDHFELSLSGSKKFNRSSKTVCAICLDKYRNPKYLECLHAFCEQPCLQRLIDRSENNIFNCPLCRRSYNVRTFECVTSDSTANEGVPLLGERTEQSTSEVSCRQLLFSLCVLGIYYYGYTTRLPVYQIAKGSLDILIAMSYSIRKYTKVYIVLLLLAISTLWLIYGTKEAWQKDDDSQYHFLTVFSRYYVVADGIMIVMIFCFLGCISERTRNILTENVNMSHASMDYS
ncbi:uncharacterized protein LOC132748069 isoform X2 [Ruditapes philippinarum]|uniref:uncharacterized protein LOC132748069 isoform X2 n=1 Tax=Ruditapes philippinarum TaxID=129788 RepID=UPI00295B39B3|nr:uncharacterized protein LOC132748069 isoform X2 [Ruditapes philippinarum]